MVVDSGWPNDPAERPGTVFSLDWGVLFDLVRILGGSSLDIETVTAEITGGVARPRVRGVAGWNAFVSGVGSEF